MVWSRNSTMLARYDRVFRSVAVLVMLLPFGLSEDGVACTVYREMGDVNLGALLSLHGSVSSRCDTEIIPRGVVHAEAMAWAVRDINSRDDILPGVTLGFDIRDDCRNEDVSLWMSLIMLENISPDAFKDACSETSFSSTNINDKLNNTARTPEIVGIIGTSRSATSIPVAQITALFQVPLMSFWASSNELSDKARFPFFLRTVPPDQHQIIAIVDMIEYFQWEYIAVIHSVDSYGLHGARELLVLTEQRGICVAFSSPVNHQPTDKELSEVVAKLVRYKYAHVVVMFSALQVANAVLGQVAKMAPGLKRTWIGGDDWGFDLTENGFTDIAQGSLFTRFYSQTVLRFEDKFSGLDPATDTVSSWFSDYTNARRRALGCWDNATECPGVFPGNLSNHFVVSPVIDGVYAFAHALDSLLKLCKVGQNCTDLNSITGQQLMPHLLKVNFTGTGGLLYFDDNADPPGKYILKNYKMLADGSYAGVEIGFWNSLNAGKRLQLQVDQIHWQGGSTEVPRSTCIPNCETGYILVPSQDKCCWTCQECRENEVVVNKTTELLTQACLACDITAWPSRNRSVCEDIIPTTLSFLDPVVITILLVALVGLILTGLTVAGFTVYRDKTLIKAASRELSSIILVGVTVAFLGVVLLLLPPTQWTCLVSEAAISLSFTLTYAPTLLKVSRIYRIFRSSKKCIRHLKWISPRNLLFVAGVLILIQILIIVISSSLSPVMALSSVPAIPTNYLELYCAFGYEFLVPCTYNLALIVACCFYAFKTRQVPDNYNESKFIAVSVYSTLVVCLATLPVYFTAGAVIQKVATLCSALLLNVYLTLVCLYLPKLYAVRFLQKDQTITTMAAMVGTISRTVEGAGGGSVVGQIKPL